MGTMGMTDRQSHLCLEFNQLYQQTLMLQSQIPALEVSARQYMQCAQSNTGNKYIVQQAKRAVRQYQSVCIRVNNNYRRLESLYRQIEHARVTANIGMQKTMCNYYTKAYRNGMSNAKKQQRQMQTNARRLQSQWNKFYGY